MTQRRGREPSYAQTCKCARVDVALGTSFFFLSFFFFLLFRAAPKAYVEVPRPRGPIGAIAAGLRHRRSNIRSEPQLMATPDP